MCESVFERKRLMRLSFVALLNARLERYAFAHLSGDPLLDFFKRVSDLGVQQLQEDRVALSSVPSVDVHEAVESSATPEHVSDPE